MVKMSRKKIVEKAAKTIDWDGMSKLLISDNARREFFNLCRAYEEVKRTLDTKFSQVIASPDIFSHISFNLVTPILLHFLEFWIVYGC